MNTKKFSEALGEIGSPYIETAVSYRPKQKPHGWIKWAVMAACLCLIVAGASVLSQHRALNPGGGTGGGDDTGMMYSVAVYPATESEANVASAEIISLTESEALSHPLAEHLPRQLPEGFHYGRGSLYSTVMKDGTQYEMLRIEYISGEIPEQQYADDGGAIAPDPNTVGDVFVVCVMNYEPNTNSTVYSSAEEVPLSVLEKSLEAHIRTEDGYVLVFIDMAEPAAVLEAIKNIA